MIRRIRIDELDAALERTRAVDADTLAISSAIVEAVRMGGERAVRTHALELGDLDRPDDTVLFNRADLERAVREIPEDQRALLSRVACRIEAFARAQRDGLTDAGIETGGGRAGYRWLPVSGAGAYAPGGRYRLLSSVLMTVIPARVAGVESAWVASPRPTAITLAAAGIAGADAVIGVGGAQAIASLAFGVFGPPADVIVGPGNRWVTAAKKHLYGEVGIDGIAGPSEVLVLADEAAKADLIAADLLAQAEHDDDAIPMLVTTSEGLAAAVDEALVSRLAHLSTAATAERACKNGFSLVVTSVDDAVAVSDRIAPEHLSIHTNDAAGVARRCTNYGTVFIGEKTTEAFADYGAGPNHVLPTNGSARFHSGLSVVNFLRCATWLELTDPSVLIPDTKSFALLEGLHGHERAAAARLPEPVHNAGT